MSRMSSVRFFLFSKPFQPNIFAFNLYIDVLIRGILFLVSQSVWLFLCPSVHLDRWVIRRTIIYMFWFCPFIQGSMDFSCLLLSDQQWTCFSLHLCQENEWHFLLKAWLVTSVRFVVYHRKWFSYYLYCNIVTNLVWILNGAMIFCCCFFFSRKKSVLHWLFYLILLLYVTGKKFFSCVFLCLMLMKEENREHYDSFVSVCMWK